MSDATRYIVECYQWGRWDSSSGRHDSFPSVERARRTINDEMTRNPDIQWWDGQSEPRDGDIRIIEEVTTRNVLVLVPRQTGAI